MLISVVLGVVIALMLVMTVPDLQKGAEMLIYFLLYWMIGIVGTAQIIDLLHTIQEGESDAGEDY
jgi:hypothetical protein